MTATTEAPVLAEAPRATEFTDAEHAMLDAMNVPAARIGRALLFRETQRTGLDPFAKHLYLREDWNEKAKRSVYAAVSTIDGFRIVAKRQPTYQGQTAPQWCGKDGQWLDVWAATEPPVAARIGVYVAGYREPMWGIARFGEYKPGGNAGFMWTKMAAHMVAKVAESLAIRKAYPDLLSGIYTDDEMAQSASATAETDSVGDTAERPAQRQPPKGPVGDEWSTPEPQEPEKPSDGLLKALHTVYGRHGLKQKDQLLVDAGLFVGRQITSTRQLTPREAAKLTDALSAARVNPVFGALVKLIADAKDVADLDATGSDIHRDTGDGNLTEGEINRLEALRRHRGEQLAAAGVEALPVAEEQREVVAA